MKKNLNTHTALFAGRAKWLMTLFICCLILAATFATVLSQAKEFPDKQAAGLIESFVEDKLAEFDGDEESIGAIAERPGKSDGHNSNGDDVLVRPPR